MKFDDLRAALLHGIEESDTRKSSHWSHYTSGRQISRAGAISGISGFGTRNQRTFLRRTLHSVFQRYLMGFTHPVFKSASYAHARQICRRQERVLDLDVVRHCCTIDLLETWKSKLNHPSVACVIGDGQANFVTLALASGLFEKVVSVNLVDILLNDLDLIETGLRLDEKDVCLVENKAEMCAFLADSKAKVALVPAHRTSSLNCCGVPLFVNIASFQEMTPEIVAEYFSIIESNSAALYCCNRELKELPGGERLEFEAYPWGKSNTLLDELCPWHQEFYSSRPPFIRPYDGPTRHRLSVWNLQ